MLCADTSTYKQCIDYIPKLSQDFRDPYNVFILYSKKNYWNFQLWLFKKIAT